MTLEAIRGMNRSVTGAQVSRETLGGFTVRERPAFGMRPTLRFALAVTGTIAYVAFSVTVSSTWRDELQRAIGPVMAWVIPIFMAYIPGVVIGFLCFTLIFTRYMPPPLGYAPQGPWPRGEWPAVTVIIAAYNEEDAIERTIDRLAATSYAGTVSVVLADNNSSDRTAELAEAAARRHEFDYRRSFEPAAGKHHALNTALVDVTTPIVVTVDADTGLHPAALSYLIARVCSRPQGQHVCACAGALIAQNPTANFLTRMQGWDYRLGINGVKRTQAAYNSALVAQGAFSAYWVEDVRVVGGWPDAIGEDIVLTWSLMSSRGLVQYEPAALADTAVPERLRHFMRQRSRWARGMLEGIRINPPQKQPRGLAKAVAGIDYLVPFLDIGYVFFWIPGVILFIFGYPLIFSWWSMLVIPITLVVYGLLRRWQDRNVFRRLNVRPEPDARGFFGYLFAYQALVSTASLRGYGQYIVGTSRRWK
jgi:poly-beta-1,6-N-acetyl-D-glucosamine synthase